MGLLDVLMSYLSISRQKEQPKPKGILILNLAVIFGFVILIGLFAVEYVGLVGKNYELRQSQKLLEEKQAFGAELKIKLTEKESVGNLQSFAQGSDLVSIEKAKYIKIGEQPVALLEKLSQ